MEFTLTLEFTFSSQLFYLFGFVRPGKGIGFRLISLFTLPFRLVSPGKGSGFRHLPRFSLPFLLLASPKGIGFRLIFLFSLPFRLVSPGKGIGFRRFSRFTLPFRQPHVSLTSPKKGAPSAPRQTKLNFKPNSVPFPIFHTISSSGGSSRKVPYQKHLSSCATSSCSQGSMAC